MGLPSFLLPVFNPLPLYFLHSLSQLKTMFLKSTKFTHQENNLHKALGVKDDILVQCRERIFFSHFTNALRAKELYSNESDAPKELTTVTGDLESCLKLIDNDQEYEITLLLFMGYHRLASKAYAEYEIHNDVSLSGEDKLKMQLIDVIMKLKTMQDKADDSANDDDDDSINADLSDIQNVVKRIQKVKDSNYSFSRYMDAMGYKTITHNGVDDILRNLFPEP